MKFIKEMRKGQRLKVNGHRLRRNSITNYLFLLKHLREFSSQKQIKLRIKHWDELNCRAQKREINYWKKFYHDFTDYLFNQKGHFDNYVGSNMKMLLAFFAWLKKEIIVDAGPLTSFFYVTHQDIQVIALNPARLNFLINDKKFETSLSESLQVWKDMFVFGCTTALRFSDLRKLNYTNLETINENVYLCVCSQKTQTVSRVYLPQFAKDILFKYRRRKLSLFPPISKTNFNKCVKKIALLAGWTEEMAKTRNRQGIPVTIYRDAEKKLHYRFCDLISSHTMRRTAITTMLRMGMHEMNVRIISGHTAQSPSFYRYVQYSESFMNEEMNKVFTKLDTFK